MPSVLVLVLVVVLAWTVVLLPVFRHRDDALREVRSYHLISSAARVVGRRRPARGDRRYLIMPRRTGLHLRRMRIAMTAEGLETVPTSVTSRGNGRTSVPSSPPPAASLRGSTPGTPSSPPARGGGSDPNSRSGRSGSRSSSSSTGRSSTVRQLRILLGLLALLVVQVTLAVLVGPGFMVGVLVSGMLLGGYVYALRRSALQRQRRRHIVARARAAHPAGSNRAARESLARQARPVPRLDARPRCRGRGRRLRGQHGSPGGLLRGRATWSRPRWAESSTADGRAKRPRQGPSRLVRPRCPVPLDRCWGCQRSRSAPSFDRGGQGFKSPRFHDPRSNSDAYRPVVPSPRCRAGPLRQKQLSSHIRSEPRLMGNSIPGPRTGRR